MKASELKGRAVVTLQEAEKIGSIDSVICDPNTSRVVGLKIKTGLFSGDRYLRVADIRSIGADAVTVPGQDRLHENEQDLPELTGLPSVDDLNGIKVVSESGNMIGTIDDVMLDMQNFRIEGYQLGGSFWQHLTSSQKNFAAPATGLRFGKGILIVPDAVEAQLMGTSTQTAAAADPTPTPTPTPDATPATAYAASDATYGSTWQTPAPAIEPSSASTSLYPASADSSAATDLSLSPGTAKATADTATVDDADKDKEAGTSGSSTSTW